MQNQETCSFHSWVLNINTLGAVNKPQDSFGWMGNYEKHHKKLQKGLQLLRQNHFIKGNYRVLLFKIKLQGKPEYFQDQFSTDFPYRTRLATGRGIRREEQNIHDVSKTSFVPRTTATWNMLPVHIRSLQSVPQFKKMLKPWIKENLPI